MIASGVVRRLAGAAVLLLGGCFDRGFTPKSFCGDGVLNPGEVCDDGNRNPTDACDRDCRPSSCGDGVLNGLERCDDGARWWGDETDGVACKPDCSEPETTCDPVPAPTWCDLESLVFEKNCSFTPAGCHTGPALEGARLNLEAGSWRNLVCAPARTEDGAGRCRVVPGNLEQSYLWSRLTGEGLGECDFRCNLMPWPRGGLCHEKYVAIREWILAGAPGPNGVPAPDCEPGCALPKDFDPGDGCEGGGDAGPEDAGPSDAGDDAGSQDAAPDAAPVDAAPDAA